MARPFLKTKTAAVLASILLSACGGDDGQMSASSSDAKLASAGCVYFCATVISAPADGETISGFVRLDVTAQNVKNAELLPDTGDKPKYGRFNLSPINASFSTAWMDLDTTKLPNGPLKVRIVLFDAPAGQPAQQEVVLTRTWNINNSITPGKLSVASVSAPGNGSVMSGMRKLEVRGTGLSNVELLPASGYTPKLGVFNINPERTYAWLDLDTRTQADGLQNVRISAFSNTAGQPGATEVVAMPARQWNFQNGLGSFRGNAVLAPVNGDIIGQSMHIEVRGTGLENVELLPATGYTPKMGIVTISDDKTKATLYVSTSKLPKGVQGFRVSAFNKPAGQSGAQEIVVMPPREFDIR